jgi:hypothetical protein
MQTQQKPQENPAKHVSKPLQLNSEQRGVFETPLLKGEKNSDRSSQVLIGVFQSDNTIV